MMAGWKLKYWKNGCEFKNKTKERDIIRNVLVYQCFNVEVVLGSQKIFKKWNTIINIVQVRNTKLELINNDYINWLWQNLAIFCFLYLKIEEF